jgi:hypothetical protein
LLLRLYEVGCIDASIIIVHGLRCSWVVSMHICSLCSCRRRFSSEVSACYLIFLFCSSRKTAGSSTCSRLCLVLVSSLVAVSQPMQLVVRC